MTIFKFGEVDDYGKEFHWEDIRTSVICQGGLKVLLFGGA
jgi:hypothetical protein